jgi:hypothetical protein
MPDQASPPGDEDDVRLVVKRFPAWLHRRLRLASALEKCDQRDIVIRALIRELTLPGEGGSGGSSAGAVTAGSAGGGGGGGGQPGASGSSGANTSQGGGGGGRGR